MRRAPLASLGVFARSERQKLDWTARNFFWSGNVKWNRKGIPDKIKEEAKRMKNQQNRWWLAVGLVLSLGMEPIALAQENKSGGMIEGEHMMEQKGDVMKSKGNMKDTGAMKDQDMMKDKGAMKDTGAMKDKGGMKDDGDKMGK
jgi:hypothetical protein